MPMERSSLDTGSSSRVVLQNGMLGTQSVLSLRLCRVNEVLSDEEGVFARNAIVR